jgi:hypothetical protein
MKPWLKTSWKNQRQEFLIGKKCIQCGTTENLVVHHHHKQREQRKIIQNKVVRQLIKEKIDKGEIQAPIKYRKRVSCPNCQVVSEFAENRKSCTCEQCNHKIIFDNSNTKIITVPNYYIGPEGYKEFLKQYKEEIEAFMKEAGAPEDPEYEDLTKDTMVLCKRCHFSIHKGMNLCPVCKKKYKSFYQQTCFDCLPEKVKEKINNHREMIRQFEEEEAKFFSEIDELE